MRDRFGLLVGGQTVRGRRSVVRRSEVGGLTIYSKRADCHGSEVRWSQVGGQMVRGRIYGIKYDRRLE